MVVRWTSIAITSCRSGFHTRFALRTSACLTPYDASACNVFFLFCRDVDAFGPTLCRKSLPSPRHEQHLRHRGQTDKGIRPLKGDDVQVDRDCRSLKRRGPSIDSRLMLQQEFVHRLHTFGVEFPGTCCKSDYAESQSRPNGEAPVNTICHLYRSFRRMTHSRYRFRQSENEEVMNKLEITLQIYWRTFRFVSVSSPSLHLARSSAASSFRYSSASHRRNVSRSSFRTL